MMRRGRRRGAGIELGAGQGEDGGRQTASLPPPPPDVDALDPPPHQARAHALPTAGQRLPDLRLSTRTRRSSTAQHHLDTCPTSPNFVLRSSTVLDSPSLSRRCYNLMLARLPQFSSECRLFSRITPPARDTDPTLAHSILRPGDERLHRYLCRSDSTPYPTPASLKSR